MENSKYLQIYNHLRLKYGYDDEQIKEIIEETRYDILEHLEGSVKYTSINEIMFDHLDFDDSFLDALFTLD